jgi:tight adherence protein B
MIWAPAIASWIPIVFFGASLMAAFVLARHALDSARSEGLLAILGPSSVSREPSPPVRSWATLHRLRRPLWMSSGLGILLGWLGWHLAGPGALLAGSILGVASPFIAAGRGRRRQKELLERQVAEAAEAAAMAVRSGLSVRQALQFAAQEAGDPVRSSLEELLVANDLGTPLETAMSRWGDGVDLDEARLLALVLAIHVRSGGDLPGALDEVAGTIRHRIAVRRELRALSAQGRTSGAILGSLPIAFFAVLAATSRAELSPVYRSTAGIAMVTAGLILEALAYLWIRWLLRVEV